MSDPFLIDQWVAHRLPARDQPFSVLPTWAFDACSTTPARWPENDTTLVLEVRSAVGCSGFFGPCSPTTIQVVADQVGPALLGMSARAHRTIATTRPKGRHISGAHFRIACSAARLAIVDLVSRQLGDSVATTLGGPTRTEVPAYATALGVATGHPLAPDIARWLKEQGFWGQKWSLRLSDSDDVFRLGGWLTALRDAVGFDTNIMIDALADWPMDHLVRMIPILAEHGVAWLEEPAKNAMSHQVRQAAVAAGLPLASGEHAYDPGAQLRAIVGHGVDVWQPDVSWHGGLVEALHISDLAHGQGIRVFPHGSAVPATVAFAGLVSPRTLPAIEFHLTQEPGRQACLTEPMMPVHGALQIRNGPGLVHGYRLDGSESTILTSLGGN